MTFLTQPYIYPASANSRSRKRLNDLMTRAALAVSHDESLRACVIGDSTWTDVGGNGRLVAAHTMLRLGHLFGNIPGCRTVSPSTSSPFAFVKGYTGSAARSVSPLDGTFDIPPGAIFGLFGIHGDNEDTYPCQQTFSSFGGEEGPSRAILGGQQYIKHDNLMVELLAAKYAGQSEDIDIYYAPTIVHGSRVSGEPNLGSDRVALTGVNTAASAVELLRFYSNPFTDVNGKVSQQLRLRATHDTGGGGDPVEPQIGSYRILNAANPKGILLDSASLGGYQAYHWYGNTSTGANANHADADVVMAQMGHDVLIFAMGTNDCYNGVSAEDFIARYYDPDGANNHGLVGKTIEAYEAAGKTVPVIVLVSHPFRADDGTGGYAAEKAEHALYTAALMDLADQLNAAGYDAIVYNQHRWTYERGFSEAVNDFEGLTDRGEWSDAAVSYLEDDGYTYEGLPYRATVDYTSGAGKEPDADGAAPLGNVYSRRVKTHISDVVHWTDAGSSLVAEGYAWFFGQHAAIRRAGTASFSRSIATAICH